LENSQLAAQVRYIMDHHGTKIIHVEIKPWF